MSNWLEKAKAQLEHHAATLEVMEGIGHLVKDALLAKHADYQTTLQAIGRATDLLIKGFDGASKITREDVDKVINEMMSRRAARNAAHDQALDDKFDGDH